MYYVTQSAIITSPIGFNIGLTNVDTRLKQLCINVVSTLFQRRALTLYQRCATLKIRRQILFHFQRRINVISTLIHKCWLGYNRAGGRELDNSNSQNFKPFQSNLISMSDKLRQDKSKTVLSGFNL